MATLKGYNAKRALKNHFTKTQKNNILKVVWYVVVVGIAIFLFKLIKSFFGSIGKSPGQLAYDNYTSDNQKDVLNKSARQLADLYKASPPNFTEAEFISMADIIDDATDNSSVSNDTEAAGLHLARVKTDSDVYRLIDAFGTRWAFFFGIPYSKHSLTQRVSETLSKEKIAKINDNYRRKGIKFRW